MKIFNFPAIGDTPENGLRLAYLSYAALLGNMFKLNNREHQVLAEILFQWQKLKEVELSDDLKWSLIFEKSNRVKMVDSIGIDNQTFANCLTSLRKKNVLKGSKVAEILLAYPQTDTKGEVSLKIQFNFNVQ